MPRITLKRILLGFAIIILLGLVGGAALVGYLVISHQQALSLPAPTGTFSVGRSEFDWVDASRLDPLADQANAQRELVVWAWYPADAGQQNKPAPYVPPAWVAARNQDQGVGKYIEHDFSSIQTHSFVGAPLTGAQNRYPVIIMQPGMGPVPTDYTVYAENLASHGYIVFGINPTYSSNVIVFPDGRVALRSEKGTVPDSAGPAAMDQDANRIGKVWADDAIFVMDKLQSINADPEDFFYNKLDLAHIGLFGHSFGGATAVRVCELDARCKAQADLDGTLFSEEASGTIHQPVMIMAEDACDTNCDTMHQMYANATSAAYYLAIKNTKHFNFSDYPVRLPPLSQVLFRSLGYIGSIPPERGLEISNAYLVAFFDQSLRGIPSDLLKSPSAAYPEVQFEKH